MDKGLELWKRLLRMSDTPYCRDENGWAWCFFCGKREDREHELDCIWIEAKKLVEENK